MTTIEGTITVHKGSYFEGIVADIKASVGQPVSMSPDEFIEVDLLGQKLEVTFHKSPSLTKIFIGKKFLINCVSFDIHLDAQNPATFQLKVVGLPTFSNKNSKKVQPFVFR